MAVAFRFSRVVLVALIVFVCAAAALCGQSRTPWRNSPPWHTFSDIVGHFSVLVPDLPDHPTAEYSKAAPPRAFSLRVYTVRSPDKPVLWAFGYVDYKDISELAPDDFLMVQLAHMLYESGKTSMRAHAIRLNGKLKDYAGEDFQVMAKKVHIEDMNLINADTLSSIPGMENVPGMPPAKPLVDNNVTGRLYLVNHRMFFLVSMAEPQAFNRQETQQFLQSFEVSSEFLIP